MTQAAAHTLHTFDSLYLLCNSTEQEMCISNTNKMLHKWYEILNYSQATGLAYSTQAENKRKIWLKQP